MQRAALAREAALSVFLLEQPGARGGDHILIDIAHLRHIGKVKQSESSECLVPGVLAEPLITFVRAPEADQPLVASVQLLPRCLDQLRVNSRVRKEILLSHRQRVAGRRSLLEASIGVLDHSLQRLGQIRQRRRINSRVRGQACLAPHPSEW